MWRNWQTRQTQNLVLVRESRFDPEHRYSHPLNHSVPECFKLVLCSLCAICYLCAPLAALIASEKNTKLRDSEAHYLVDLTQDKPIVLTVLQATAVYADRMRNGHLRNFLAGEQVQLLAYASETFLVKRIKDSSEGWVAASDLTPPEPDQLASALARLEDARLMKEAVREKRVLEGMTTEEVRKVLGKPDESAFRRDANGRSDLWTYIEYKTVYEDHPYADPVTGNIHVNRLRKKVPDQELSVEFTNGRVTAIEKKRLR